VKPGSGAAIGVVVATCVATSSSINAFTAAAVIGLRPLELLAPTATIPEVATSEEATSSAKRLPVRLSAAAIAFPRRRA
jgi:hypothetical protein